MDAPNLQSDLRYLKRKVEAGAEFLVTQMFSGVAKLLVGISKTIVNFYQSNKAQFYTGLFLRL